MWRDLLDKGLWSGEIWNRRKSGEIYPEMLTISALRDAQGITRRYMAMFSDITQRKQMEEQVHQLAFYDALTGLPNRRLLEDRLKQVMVSSKRSGLYGALMFLDLDNFKPLNDAQGHAVGDLLLVEVASRLSACLREADTVARFGGDEFVVMLGELTRDEVSSTEQALYVAEKIRASVAAPYYLAVMREGQEETIVEHRCSVSIGMVMFINHSASLAEILKWADMAMYQAKDAGRNLVRMYEEK
jgi:diguanylate cyclase (GGDEF)-like protein